MDENKDQARAADAPSEPSDAAHHARLVLIRDLGDADLVESVTQGKVSIRAALLQALRAADALNSQPTEPDGCAECRHTYCMSGEVCKACGDVAMQGWKGGRQPTDGGVRNG